MAATDALNLAELPAKLGTYAQSNQKKILSAILLSDLSFLKYVGNTLTGNDEFPLTELVMNDLLQPGGKDTFNPTNIGKFKARVGKVRACKADVSFKPSVIQALWKSYIGQIDGGRITTDAIPFQAFIFAKIVEKVKQNLHLKAAFKGILNAAGTTPADTMNGWLKLILDAIVDGSIPGENLAQASVISTANAIDKFNEVMDLVPDEYYDQPMVCLAAPKNIRNYNNCYQRTNGALPYNTEFKKTFLEGTNVEMIGEPGLSGTNHIIITPKDNLFWLADNTAMDSVVVEKEKRNLHIMLDFQAAPDFGMGSLIWTNIND